MGKRGGGGGGGGGVFLPPIPLAFHGGSPKNPPVLIYSPRAFGARVPIPKNEQYLSLLVLASPTCLRNESGFKILKKLWCCVGGRV